MVVGDELILRVEASGKAVVVIGPVHIVLNVFFAAPDNLHRPIDLLCDRDRLRDPVHVQPPSEAATEKVVMNSDLFGREAGDFRCRGLRPSRHLNADPNIAAVLRHIDGAVHRLHGGVG